MSALQTSQAQNAAASKLKHQLHDQIEEVDQTSQHNDLQGSRDRLCKKGIHKTTSQIDLFCHDKRLESFSFRGLIFILEGSCRGNEHNQRRRSTDQIKETDH
jgi:hypothetical protein